MTRSSI